MTESVWDVALALVSFKVIWLSNIGAENTALEILPGETITVCSLDQMLGYTLYLQYLIHFTTILQDKFCYYSHFMNKNMRNRKF